MNNALLEKFRSDYAARPAQLATDHEEPRKIGQTTLSLDLIRPNPNQPRKHFSDKKHQELVHSIRERGVLQPIRVLEVRTMAEYEIIAGERRWRAAKEAGLTEIPVIIVREQPNVQAMIDSLVENIQREDLTPLDRANFLMDLRVHLGGLSWDETLKRSGLGIKRSQLFYLLGLRSLPEPIQADIQEGMLNEKHGRALRSLAKDPEAQEQAWQHIRQNGLSGDDALSYVRSLKTKSQPARRFSVSYRTDLELIAQLEAKLQELRTDPSQ